MSLFNFISILSLFLLKARARLHCVLHLNIQDQWHTFVSEDGRTLMHLGTITCVYTKMRTRIYVPVESTKYHHLRVMGAVSNTSDNCDLKLWVDYNCYGMLLTTKPMAGLMRHFISYKEITTYTLTWLQAHIKKDVFKRWFHRK